MNQHEIIKLNGFIKEAYECSNFSDFLRLSILRLHEFVLYDSGMFFCAISRDCSYFKPCIGGGIEGCCVRQEFSEKEEYLNSAQELGAGSEAYVYKAADYSQGVVQIDHEPRSSFLSGQSDFHIVCVRIVYKGQFLGEIYLHRSKAERDFSAEDLFILRLLQPHISTVFNIIHTVTAVQATENSSLEGAQKGLCLLGSSLNLVSGNLTGVGMLKITTAFGSSVLYHVKEMCTMLGDSLQGGNRQQAACRSETLSIADNNLHVKVLAAGGGSEEIQYAVVMEFCDREKSIADYRFKFSKRESEIIDGLIQGKNNLQLAKMLHLSENTIKTHIRSIYKKTGTCNRTELTYVLMLNTPL